MKSALTRVLGERFHPCRLVQFGARRFKPADCLIWNGLLFDIVDEALDRAGLCARGVRGGTSKALRGERHEAAKDEQKGRGSAHSADYTATCVPQRF